MWDERYSTEEYVYGLDPNELLANAVTKIPKGKVLCAAEDENCNAIFLTEHVYDVVTIDSSSAELEKPANLMSK